MAKSIPAPTVNAQVHYRSFGTPGGEFPAACRAATVTEMDLDVPKSLGGERVGLVVFNPTGLFFHSLADGGSRYSTGAETLGAPDCPNRESHGSPFRYCSCGWVEASFPGGTWHWPEDCQP